MTRYLSCPASRISSDRVCQIFCLFLSTPATSDQEQVETDFLLTAGDPAGTFVCVVVGTNQRTTGQVGGASHRNSARPPTAA